jgi:hypothetical protein
MLIPSIHNSLNELIDLLGQLSQTEYSNSCAELSNATIESIRDILLKCFNVLKINMI